MQVSQSKEKVKHLCGGKVVKRKGETRLKVHSEGGGWGKQGFWKIK